MKRVFLLGLLAGCGGAKDAPRAPVETATGTPDPATLVVADTVTVELPLTLPAQLYVEHDAALYARSAGIIEAIQADLGSRVEAGQVLARLESADQEIALAQARERHSNAKIQVARQRTRGSDDRVPELQAKVGGRQVGTHGTRSSPLYGTLRSTPAICS